MNIPTAEEFLRGKPFSIESIYNNMIEFAKLHVQAALKAADDNSIMYKDLGEGEDGELCCVLEKT